LILSAGAVLANVVRTLARATGSSPIGDGGRAAEELGQRLEGRAFQRAPGERVLDDLVLPLGAAHLTAQLGHLGHLQALVVDNDRAVGALERLFELLQLFFFERSSDCH